MKQYNVTLLRGDGIGPEIVDQAVRVLDAVASKFGFEIRYTPELIGGCAIDETGCPLPQKTVDSCLASDAVLLGAVGGYKWDTLPGKQRPEAGLLGIRAALGLFGPVTNWDISAADIFLSGTLQSILLSMLFSLLIFPTVSKIKRKTE